MHQSTRHEVEGFANEKFRAGIENRLGTEAKKKAEALARVRDSGNSGGLLPALVECRQESLRANILAMADAWVEAGILYAVALGRWAEEKLEQSALQMAEGANSGLHCELNRLAVRTKRHIGNHSGREIQQTLNTALREGKLRLKTQSVLHKRSLTESDPADDISQLNGTGYDPLWNLRDGGDNPANSSASFSRLARHALLALNRHFSNPLAAADLWLNQLHEFYSSRSRSDYASNDWRVKRVLEASAEYCAEVATGFLEAGDLVTSRTLTELERQFRASPDPPDPMAKLSAYRRRAADINEDVATEELPVSGVLMGNADVGTVCEEQFIQNAQAHSSSKRAKATVNCPSAAQQMEEWLEDKVIGLTKFANQIGITDRTLRSFRKTGKIRRDSFQKIAELMGTTAEELLKPK
jgi:hypothetical protein